MSVMPKPKSHGCDCMCHKMPGVKHIMPCCKRTYQLDADALPEQKSAAAFARRRLNDEEYARAQAEVAPMRGRGAFTVWPKGYEQYNGATAPCDMWDGPCVCGATHSDGK